KGRNVMKGYYRRPEETAQALRDGWFHTGDTGFFDKDGYLYLTGRKDEMIVLPNGKNIDPEEVESGIMNLSPLVQEVGVTMSEGRLIALVLPNLAMQGAAKFHEFADTIKHEIVERYNRTAAQYKKILKVLFVAEEFPKTRLGKLKRFMFSELLHRAKKTAASAADDNSREFEIIRNFLGKMTDEHIAADRHLELDLGLDSLDHFMVLAFIEKTFGITMTSSDIISDPTVGGLVQFIRSRTANITDHGVNIDWHEILSRSAMEFHKKPTNLYKTIPLARLFFRFLFSFQCSGTANVPEEPFILAANHQSYLDIMALSISLPRPVIGNSFFWVKASRFASEIVRFLTGNRSIIILDRESLLKQALLKSASLLKNGHNLIVFPEGIRTRDGKMAKFKKTFAILARELNIPILPARIDGAHKALPYRSARIRRSKITVRFLSPIYPGSMSYDEITQRVESAIAQFENGGA
ncbi:MAG: long-chain fatty acid--CoA ligase, partial [Spirochaetaceae bacterium]